MACCSRSSPASTCSAACASCAAACAMPVAPIRCSAACAPRRISRSHPPRWPRWRRGACRCALFHHRCRGCCPRDSNRCRWPHCAGPRNRTRASRPWAYARSVNSCACRAPASRGVSVRSMLADLDRLLGRRADPRRAPRAPRALSGVRDFDHEIEDHERILQALRALAGRSSSISCACASAASRRCNAVSIITARRRRAARCGWPRPRPTPKDSRTCCANVWPTLVLPEPVRRCEVAQRRAQRIAPRPAGRCGRPANAGHATAGEMPALMRTPARTARHRGGVRHLPRPGTPARTRLAYGRTRARQPQNGDILCNDRGGSAPLSPLNGMSPFSGRCGCCTLAAAARSAARPAAA